MSNMNFLYENITNRIIKLLEEGKTPWHKTWKASEMPMNLTTKYPYRGINVWTLLSSPLATTPYWVTWNQVMKLKGRGKDTEAKNYETVVFWKQLKYKNTKADGTEDENSFPMLRYTRVYNLDQCEFDAETLKKLVPKTEVNDFNPITKCEEILSSYKDCPVVNHGGDRAYYAPMFDKIQIPSKEDFKSPEEYYSTLFHEMAHSTGSEKRLKRFKATDSNIFGSETYSKEELVAEMTASFLCAEAEIENKILENAAAYIQGWLRAIKNSDNRFVLQAASKAQAAAEYNLGKKKNEEAE